MNIGIEFIDFVAAAMTLAFIAKLLFARDLDNTPSSSGNREKLSLLNQNINARARMA